MSIEAITAAWAIPIKDPTTKYVLVAMLDHADKFGYNIFPAVETVAEKTSLCEKTVRRHIKKLVADGILIPAGKSKYGTHNFVFPMTDRTFSPIRPDFQSQKLDSESTNPSLTVNEPKRAANAAPVVVGTTQQPTIMATEIVNSTAMEPKRDAVTDFFERAVKAKTHKDIINAWKGQQHLKDVCITLCDVTGLQVTKGDAGKWMKGAVALHELGATDEILRRVWNEATPRDRQFMTHPAAFTERVRSALANQPAAQNAGVSRAEWVTTPSGKILRYDGVPYPGDAGRQKCVELGITYEGN